MASKPESCKRILIVKLSSIGDVVMASPVAKALRNAFPDSHISWVVESKSKDVVIGNPYIDEAIIWERTSAGTPFLLKSVEFISNLLKLRRELRARKFDVAIDFQGLLRSGIITRISGARQRLGSDKAREKATWFYNRQLITADKLMTGPQQYLTLLELIGISSTDLDMHVSFTNNDRAYAAGLIEGELAGHPECRGIASLCPSTTWDQKHWREDGWAELADKLYSEHGLLPVFHGSKGDLPLIDRILGMTHNPAGVATGKTTLKQAAAILDRSEVVFAVDTGLLHISMALGRPSVGIFGPTRWKHFAQKPNFQAVAKEWTCMPCLRHPGCRDYPCIKGISADDVLAVARRWLGEPSTQAPAPQRWRPGGPMHRLRTLHVETGMHALGGPAQVAYLVAGLQKTGHESCLVCPEGSSICKHAVAAGLNVISVPLRTDLDASFIFRLCRIIRAFKPDVVHLHSRRGADIMGGIAARICGVPAVILSRRIDDPVKKGLISRLKYGPLCDRIIAISNGIVEALRKGGVQEEKINCVRSVVDAKRYQSDAESAEVREELGIDNRAKVVAIVAQLIERKGHKYLFQAAPRILDSHPDTVFLVLGQGRLENELKRQVASIGIGDRVIFAGFRDDMSRVLKAIDLLVHPASMEGLGIAILQAMAAGVPVVATRVGGIPESVRDGVNGMLIPPRNPDAIADAVIRLLDSPDLRSEMGDAGRRIVEEEFSVDGMVRGVLGVYADVLHLDRTLVGLPGRQR